MATVVGFVEQARAFLPDFVARRRRPDSVSDPRPAESRDALIAFRPIAELVDRTVLPSIVEAHRDEVAATPAERLRAESVALATLALDADAAELADRIDAMLERGMTVDTVLVDVLAPAARHLGTMWEQDDCDFVSVTMGLWRLQQVVRDLSARVPVSGRGSDEQRSALFSPMPGEDHNFGTVIVEDIFRRAGWATDILLETDRARLLKAVGAAHLDLLGLTVSCDANTERLPSLITAIRSVSRNPRLCILLGGPVLMADPQIAIRVGADGTAADAQQAVALADRLVTANACREVFTA